MPKKRIGELLLERRVISAQQLQDALLAQQRTRQRLGATLVAQGALSESQLAHVLAESLALPTVDLSKVQADWSAVHMLKPDFCERHELFPFALERRAGSPMRLVVALADPLNAVAVQAIEFTTGLRVAACVATHSQIRQALGRYCHRDSTGSTDTVPREPVPPLSSSEPEAAEIPQSPSRADAPAASTVSKDLAFLFGSSHDDHLERLEAKFWALMRVLSRKQLVTREEFNAELEEGG